MGSTTSCTSKPALFDFQGPLGTKVTISESTFHCVYSGIATPGLTPEPFDTIITKTNDNEYKIELNSNNINISCTLISYFGNASIPSKIENINTNGYACSINGVYDVDLYTERDCRQVSGNIISTTPPSGVVTFTMITTPYVTSNFTYADQDTYTVNIYGCVSDEGNIGIKNYATVKFQRVRREGRADIKPGIQSEDGGGGGFTVNENRAINNQNRRMSNSQISYNKGRNQQVINPCIGCSDIKIPTLVLSVFTLANGSDIGEAYFVIQDTINYETQQVQDNTCKLRYSSQENLITSKFRKCCPYIVSVLRNIGITAQEKVSNMWTLEQPTETFPEFYLGIMVYAMLRYILSRLMYGDFNIDYLLNQYTEKFLYDLNHSRFCQFAPFFLDCNSIIPGFDVTIFGYEKYFL